MEHASTGGSRLDRLVAGDGDPVSAAGLLRVTSHGNGLAIDGALLGDERAPVVEIDSAGETLPFKDIHNPSRHDHDYHREAEVTVESWPAAQARPPPRDESGQTGHYGRTNRALSN